MLEDGHAGGLEVLAHRLERRLGAGSRHEHGADALAEDLVPVGGHRALDDAGHLRQHVVEFLRRDLHAAAHDQLLEAADEPVVARLGVVAGEFEQVAGPEPAVPGERFRGHLGIAEIAVEHRRAGDLQLAGSAGLGDLLPGFGIHQSRAEVRETGRFPVHVVAAQGREHPRTMHRILRVGRIAHQRDALVRPEGVDHLDAEAVAVAGDHLRVERRRARADAAQARQVDAREQLLVLQQHVEHGRWCDRVLRTLDRDLPEVDRQVERVVQHQRAGAVQPAHEAAADGGHVDQRERIEQALAAPDAGAVEMRVADADPVVVRARHALRQAFRARRPADGGNVVGGEAERGLMPREPFPRGRVEGGRYQGLAARRRGRAEREHAQIAARGQFERGRRAVLALEAGRDEDRACLREIGDRLQFVVAELHRHRAHDDAEAHRGQVHRRVLGDVRQLRDQEIVAAQAEFEQAQRVSVHEVRELRVRVALRRNARERFAIGRVEHGELLRRGARRGREEIGNAPVRPPAAVPVLAGEFFGRRAHIVSADLGRGQYRQARAAAAMRGRGCRAGHPSCKVH